ncbi:MAG: hypothetical protein LIP12_07770 [Clostridiales bacterium]|nr:hypothetical protein [Clostridiales bacterium]
MSDYNNTNNTGAATAAPSSLYAVGSADWAAARVKEIDKQLAVYNTPIAHNATETMIADAIAGDYFRQYPATVPELKTKLTAQAYYGALTDQIMTVIATENAGPGRTGKNKLSMSPKSYASMIMMHAILSTGEVRMIYEDNDADKCRFAIREWIPGENGRPGHYTGVWVPFEFGGNRTAIADIMETMMPGMSRSDKWDAIDTMQTTFKARVAVGYSNARNWGFRLIPCHNGVVEGYADGSPVTFTPWDDIDTLNERYKDWCPLYTLGIDYNPDAQCPDYLPPDDYLASLFPDDELGQAEVRVMWYVMQMGVRGWATKDGRMVVLANADNGSRGRNGKSSLINVLRNLFEFLKENPHICTKPFSQCFTGFDSACLLDEVLHISAEDNGTIDGSEIMKSYIRYDPVDIRRKNMGDIKLKSEVLKMQAQNSMPKFAKKNMSLADMNRFVVFKMEMDFSENSEKYNPHINEYTKRKDWLEYFLLRLTQLPFVEDYDINDLDIMEVNHKQMVDDNMPTQAMIEDLLEQINVSVIPVTVVHTLYNKWARDNAKFSEISPKQFLQDAEIYCTEHPGKWQIEKGNKRPLRAAELAEFGAVQHCQALLDYATVETGFAKKSPSSYGRPKVTGEFDVDNLKCHKYGSFFVAV